MVTVKIGDNFLLLIPCSIIIDIYFIEKNCPVITFGYFCLFIALSAFVSADMYLIICILSKTLAHCLPLSFKASAYSTS